MSKEKFLSECKKLGYEDDIDRLYALKRHLIPVKTVKDYLASCNSDDFEGMLSFLYFPLIKRAYEKELSKDELGKLKGIESSYSVRSAIISLDSAGDVAVAAGRR